MTRLCSPFMKGHNGSTHLHRRADPQEECEQELDKVHARLCYRPDDEDCRGNGDDGKGQKALERSVANISKPQVKK
uniref:Uncharacterized protein n=1 Tax=Pristionchus pacificus TaxID=54126 RepID=A0A2A6CPY7_PRIPA|eukprot:PDM80180.1 hypothetical protein PRIPAC_32759 [Pristionchus pacificus]